LSDREKFLAERRTCLGGSDAPDLLELAPFGCTRKLWYDKKGVPEDFPFDVNFHVRRGNAIEPIALAEFCREFQCGQLPHAPGQAPPHTIHASIPYIGAHVDEFITMPFERGNGEVGVLEIKVPASRHFQKIKSSGMPPASWIAQVQWNMLATELHWGALGVFNPDIFKILRFDVAEDLEAQEGMKTLAEIFWDSLTLDKPPYAQLPEGDARCYECSWRTKCKGLGRTPSSVTDQERLDLARQAYELDESPELLKLINEYLTAKAEFNEAKKWSEDLKEEVEETLGNRHVILADGRRVWFQETLVNMKAKEAETQRRRSLKVL
jgi:hypothetical protein